MIKQEIKHEQFITDREIDKLKKKVDDYFASFNRSSDEFDYTAYLQKNLNYEENERIIFEKLHNLGLKETISVNIQKPEVMRDEKVEEMKQQALFKAEQEADIRFEETLKRIEETKTSDILEQIFFIPKQYARMVASGYAKGYILWGECGTGKSFSVIRAFREMNKQFVMLRGHISSMKLYEFLYEHRKENIVLDDVNILDDEKNLNMLKACLDNDNRIVQYHSSSSKLNAPNRFLFEGTLIILLNHKGNNGSIEAVESRVLNYELKMDYKTKLKVMLELIKQDYKTLSYEDRKTIFSFIKDNTSEATSNFNLRKLFQVYEFYLFDKQEWEKLALSIFETDEEKQLIIKGMGWKDWVEATGKSKRSFYYYSKLLNKK